MLEIRNLQFAYQSESPLLDGISFVAHPGDIIWIHGVNGCGKTTFLRIIAQLLKAQGEIFYCNRMITSKEDLLSYLTFIPTNPYLFDYLTGEENARFLQDLFQIPKYVFQSRFLHFIDHFGITDSLGKYVQEFSLGMRHKLFWAAMFSRESMIYLLDEPFSAFDSSAQRMAKKIIMERASKGGILIFASHLDQMSTNLANRYLMLDSGNLMESIRPIERLIP